MKRRKWLFGFILAAVIFAGFLKADEKKDIPGLDQKDVEELRDWIKNKRQVRTKKAGGVLSISGQVRSELQSTNEKKDGIKQRGSGGAVSGTAMRAWDVQANLLLDYRRARNWAVIRLVFDNNAGIEGGGSRGISLNRAFLGGRVVNAPLYTIDLEIGRRGLGYVFDSEVQFGARMDGLLFKYDHALESFGDLYFHGGPFLVNETLDQYAYVGELGVLNIFKTGLYSKLSYIDWDTKNTDNELRNSAFRFRNIQLVLGYKFVMPKLKKATTLYSGGLVNTAARKEEVTCRKKQNYAWYFGFSIGRLKKAWDYSLDVNYQWVQAQAVPDFDAVGTGRGNAAGIGLYSTESYGKGTATTKETAVGEGNFKGIAIEFQFNLTSNITVYQGYRQTVNYTQLIGPPFSYKQYEIEFIFSF